MRQKELEIISRTVYDHITAVQSFFTKNSGKLLLLSDEIATSLRRGGKMLLFGNGGSAADAQHMASELVNRLSRKRRAIPAVALTTDSPIITSIANDFSFDEIFSRQIEALGKPGDMAFGISTSGRSRNVLRALRLARSMGLKTSALLGRDGGPIRKITSISLIVPCDDTQRIQEVHGIIGHLLCAIIEDRLYHR